MRIGAADPVPEEHLSIGGNITFAGYRRDDGRYGVRNHVLVLGLNGLVARAAARIAAGVSGTVLFASSYGRGQFGDDRRAHTAQLIGLGRNPKRWLKPGETVTVTVEGLGSLTNPVVAEQ